MTDILTPTDPPARKIAIVGWAPTYAKAPWADPTWEKWILNDMYRVIPDGTYSRIYEVHNAAEIARCEERGEIPPNHIATLSTKLAEIHALHPQDYPDAVAIDHARMVANFGAYFTCTISYMVADCILEGVSEIGIWGVDLAVGSEYTYERPGVEYMLGIAKGRGIPVTLPPESDLLTAIGLYGLEEEGVSGFAANINERITKLEGKRNEIHAANQANNNALLQIMGALEVLCYHRDVWMPKGGRRRENHYTPGEFSQVIAMSDGSAPGLETQPGELVQVQVIPSDLPGQNLVPAGTV